MVVPVLRVRDLLAAATSHTIAAVPDLDQAPAEIDDAQLLLERIAYRNARLLDRTGHERDPIWFVHDMAGRNRSDLRRLAELMGHDISDLIA